MVKKGKKVAIKQKQKQRQTVNVKVHIDNSKKVSKRKPRSGGATQASSGVIPFTPVYIQSGNLPIEYHKPSLVNPPPVSSGTITEVKPRDGWETPYHTIKDKPQSILKTPSSPTNSIASSSVMRPTNISSNIKNDSFQFDDVLKSRSASGGSNFTNENPLNRPHISNPSVGTRYHQALLEEASAEARRGRPSPTTAFRTNLGIIPTLVTQPVAVINRGGRPAAKERKPDESDAQYQARMIKNKKQQEKNANARKKSSQGI